MSVKRIETNVRVPESALAALQELGAERGLSRDALLRELLDEYLRFQEPLSPGNRLTHVCTLLRYPAPPERRGQKPGGVLLRLRLDPGVAERARAVSLRLPGQSEGRGPRDYQPRLLADAVLTAIERARPLTDPFLDGLALRLVTHDTAKGLWGLVVAASLTGAEEELHADADPDWPELSHRPARRPLPREVAVAVAEVLEEQEAWHAPYRYALLAHFMREMLSSPDAAAHVKMLHEQGLAWEKEQYDLRRRTDRDHWLLAGAPRGDDEAPQGRGSSAVWKGRRRLALEELGEWLRAQNRPGPVCEHVVDPPGWRLRQPDGWHSLVLPPNATPAPAWAGHLQEARLLAVRVRSRTVLWPVHTPAGGAGPVPVPGVEAAFAALARRTRRQPLVAVEAVLARFDSLPDHRIDPDGDQHSTAGTRDRGPDRSDNQVAPLRNEIHDDQPFEVPVPAAVACDLGLIDPATRDRLTADAYENVIEDMRDAVARLERDSEPRIDERGLASLRSSVSPDKLGYFARILAKAEIAFSPRVALWHWPIRSVIEAIAQGYAPAAVGWLVEWSAATLDRTAREQRSEAWDAGFVRFRSS